MSATRQSLHAVAAYVLAGPQYDASGTIRLAVTDTGITTVAEPQVTLRGTDLVSADGAVVAISGHTSGSLAEAVGLRARRLDDVYPDQPALGVDDVLEIDPDEAGRLVSALVVGAAALARIGAGDAPVLWPEHFDVGVSLDEVNYGVSPGDAGISEPYAYVGPWAVPDRDDFWTQPFGAARAMADLADADTVLAFFRQGQARLGR